MINLDSGRSFWKGSTGRWAGEQLLKALKEGKQITTEALRTLDTLHKDEWKFFDSQLIEEAHIRLRAVGVILGAGLSRTIPNGLAKTVYEYEKVTDLEPATISMDGMTRGDNDRVEFELDGMPLPITHKDFFINLRTLLASRERGEGLDATQIRLAGRVIAEATEQMLLVGGKTFQGKLIYGLTTHPDRNQISFGAGGDWGQVAKTGDQKLGDIQSMLAAAEADNMYGPFHLFVNRGANIRLDSDFKTNGDRTTRQRLLEIDGLQGITTVDLLPAPALVLVQLTQDVIQMIEGVPLQTIQWDVQGGFQVNFKGFQIMVPLVRSDSAHRSGIVHMS